MIHTNKQRVFLKHLKQFLLWYVIAIAILTIGIVILILTSDLENEDGFSIFSEVMGRLFKSRYTYIVLLIPYLLFLLIRSIFRDYKKQKFLGLLKGIAFKVLLPVAIIWGSMASINHYRFDENFSYDWDFAIENKSDRIRNLYEQDKKQRGFHFFGRSIDSTSYENLKTNNVEWLTLVPFIPQENYNDPFMYNRKRKSNNLENRHQGWRDIVANTKAYGFKIMMKPHIWLLNRDNGKWRSDITMSTQEEWDLWFEDYSDNILEYAALAEELKMEMFCIGTELHQTILEQPEHWKQLIAKVRAIYSGQLTYGANWNQEVEDIPFWDALDFIGVQAYYPVAKNENPELPELENGWKKHIQFLESLHRKYQKPILFTELGYKSTTDAGIKPWEWNTLGNRFHKKISKRTQALCYQAFFNTIWQKPWLKGVHLWEWQSNDDDSDGNNNAFVVQGKPALNVIAKEFKKVMD